jgi:hypothetical protein
MLKVASVCVGVGVEDDKNVRRDIRVLGRLYEIGDWANPFLLAHAGITFHGKVDHAELQRLFHGMTPLAKEKR